MSTIDPVSASIGSLTSGQKHLEDSFNQLRIDMAARSDLIHGRLDEMMSEIRTKIHEGNNKAQVSITSVGNDVRSIEGNIRTVSERVTVLENIRDDKRTNKRLLATLWVGSGAVIVALIEHWNDFFGRH